MSNQTNHPRIEAMIALSKAGWTYAEIAAAFSTTQNNVCALLRYHGVHKRTSKPSEHITTSQLRELHAQHVQGASVRSLARQKGLTKTTLCRMLHAHELPIVQHGAGRPPKRGGTH
jgi:predicted transcriptional regulator